MGIDIGFADTETESAEEEIDMERVCSVPGFFSMAEVLSKLLDTMDENNIPYSFETPELEPVVEAFNFFVNEDPEIFEERFSSYCEFVRGAYQIAREQSTTGTDALTGQSFVDPHPEEFRPDVRAFLGRSILIQEPITPEMAEEIVPPMMFARALVAQFTAHFKDENPELSKHLENVEEMLATITKYFMESIEERKTVLISY